MHLPKITYECTFGNNQSNHLKKQSEQSTMDGTGNVLMVCCYPGMSCGQRIGPIMINTSIFFEIYPLNTPTCYQKRRNPKLKKKAHLPAHLERDPSSFPFPFVFLNLN
jgi:hypothetical protein